MPLSSNASLGIVNAGNSTNVPLDADATFTGATIDTLGVADLSISVYSDVASAAGGLEMQFSIDGTNFNDVIKHTVSAADGTYVGLGSRARYFRITYRNGPVAQAVFRLQVILRTSAPRALNQRLRDPVSPTINAAVVKAVVNAQDPSGSFVNVRSSDSGALMVSGSVHVTNMPAVQEVAGTVSVSNATLNVTGSLRLSEPASVTGSVAVSGPLPLPAGAATEMTQATVVSNLQALNSLVPDRFDHVALTYTGDNVTGVVYRLGGPSGTVVSTLVLGYDNDNLTTVSRS